jgi:hypothetical protein
MMVVLPVPAAPVRTNDLSFLLLINTFEMINI